MEGKKAVRLASWAKGMMTAPSRMDLPIDSLSYAENVDFTVPMRQGLIENDAIIGDGGAAGPTPDHNTAADTTLGWGWLDGTPSVGSFAAMGRIPFSGEEYIYKVDSAGDVELQKVIGEVAWADIDFGTDAFDTTRKPHSDGERVTFPLEAVSDERRLAALYDPGSADLPVGGKMVALELEIDTGTDASYVYRLGTLVNHWYAFRCVKDHTSPAADVDGRTAWLPYGTVLTDELTLNTGPTRDWTDYWVYVGVYLVDPGIPEWDTGEAYVSHKAVLTVTTTASPVADITPSALPVEYIGTPTEDTVAVSPMPAATGSSPDDETYPAYRPDTTHGSWPWDLPDILDDGPPANPYLPAIPADSGLLMGGGGLHIQGYLFTYRKPADTVTGLNPSITPSPFLITPVWESGAAVSYYIVYELVHGGFSEPVKLFTASVAAADIAHDAVAFQVWSKLADWPESAVRIHAFRIDEVSKADSWLFAVDRETSSWICIGDTAGADEWLMAPAPISTALTGETYDGFGQGGRPADLLTPDEDTASIYTKAGYMGMNAAATGDSHARTAATRAFLALAASGGINLTPVIKGGCGLFSFVDYGQDSGETATTILGAPLADLVDAATKRYYDLALVGFAQGRAFYTDPAELSGGTVYYSSVGKYSIIDPMSNFYFADSGSLTAIESVGSYILLLFRNKTVILDARSGMDIGWSTVAELEGVGCDGADLVARHESLVFWAGGGTVRVWDGAGRPQRVSEPIEYPGFADDMANATRAWMAVDPTRKELLLYLLRTTYSSGWGERFFKDDLEGVQVRGKCLVYSIATGSWSTETFRSLANATGDDAYKFLGRPFTLGGHLLIPCGVDADDDYDYLVVRQAYHRLLPAGAHEPLMPPWKRAVMETGYLDLGSLGVEKKLKRLHAAFTGSLKYGDVLTDGISSYILDHWKAYIYTFSRRASDAEVAPWVGLSAMTPAKAYDFALEAGTGYTSSIYTKNNLPSRPLSMVAVGLVSQGTANHVIWTNGKKYRCKQTHTATVANSPTGTNGTDYWTDLGTASASDLVYFKAWALGARYGAVYETLATHVELGLLEMSFATKSKV